jgi:type IV secretion system protein VirB5
MNLHKSTTYKPADIKNPFLEGQDRAYADILLDKMNEMRWWRGIVGVGILALFATALILFVYALSLQKTVPVLVNVMPTGEAQYLGEVHNTSASLAVPEAAILYQIRKFISNLRSVSADPQVLYNNIEECYAMITNTYEPAMTRLLRGNSPFDLVGKTRRTVTVESVLKITERSYQIDWIESTADSTSTKNARMRALITVAILPTNAETVKANPLGIYIENCEMTEL